jgi:glycosyltransferase involved in cell wall biosynthesis
MERFGIRVTYLGRLTPSHTLNLLLLPLEVAVRRDAGARLVHLHWVFGFSFPGTDRFMAGRRLAQAWFTLWLRITRTLGVRIVWTAHNVLPHDQVFADDVCARQALVAASDLVITHSQEALSGLARLGAVPRKSVVIPHGPLAPTIPATSLRAPGSGDGPRQILFFGKVQEYKGIEDLLAAFMALPSDAPAVLTVAGQCDDPGLRSRLSALAASSERVVLHLQRIPDQDVTPLLASADVVVLPYRRVTTSGSAMLALAHGRPLIVPELDSLADLPQAAIVSYNGTRLALGSALAQMAYAENSTLARMAEAARTYSSRVTWQEIAARTISEMCAILGCTPGTGCQSEALPRNDIPSGCHEPE